MRERGCFAVSLYENYLCLLLTINTLTHNLQVETAGYVFMGVMINGNGGGIIIFNDARECCLCT